jgi:hypothetical protein
MIEHLANFLGAVAKDVIVNDLEGSLRFRNLASLGAVTLEIRPQYHTRDAGWGYHADLTYSTRGYVGAGRLGRS